MNIVKLLSLSIFILTDFESKLIIFIQTGNLIIEVVLKESDEFGTVIARVKAPIGVPIVEETTFDERTMWSPRNKTPLFLLIFPNLFILGVWGIIIYLIINLFKINKSKNENN